MPSYRSIPRRLLKAAKARVAPGRRGVLPSRALLEEYEVADLIEIDGKVPVNYFSYRPNFGDLLSPWLVRKMTGREVVRADRSKPHYVVIGSIISQGTDQSIFWGTGSYGTEERSEVASNAQFTAVRGPLTQAKLSAAKGFGIPVPEVYGDPALLLPLYYRPRVPITHEYGVVVRWSEREWAEATYGPGVKLIDFARADVAGVIRDLLSCRRIASSSLHGLIVADAYGIPNAWLASSTPRGGVFKYYDYFASVNKFRQPQRLDLSAGKVTTKLLADSLTFSGEPISFDHRALLDASPFLRRKSGVRTSAAKSLPTPESGVRLRSQAGRETFLPSLGYFGGIAANYLPVPVTGPVSRIRLFLPESDGELDLRGLELFRNGRRVDLEDVSIAYAQSSEGGRPAEQRKPFAFGGIRTVKEPGPWWSATLDPPVEADEIRVYNRTDGWGARARALTVAVADPDGVFHTVRSVDSDRVIEATFALLRRLTGLALDTSVLATKDSADRARREVLAELARRAGEGLLTGDREEQRLLASIIRRQKLGPDETLTDDEWTVLGHLLAAERARVPGTKTSVVAFHRVLGSRAKLNRLQDEVNKAGEVLGTPRAVLTRHGFTDIGMLRKRSADYLGVMERVTATLQECGYPAMLAYGTLLGAVREGDFLAHDDDVDLLIPMEVTSREEFEQALVPLAATLRSKGWRVSRPNTYTNFHLTEVATGLHVDVFPLMVDGDRASLHMEKMRLRDVPTSIMLPPRPFTFLGRELLAPADPEAFLADRYGDGWSTPDPFYDWPWKLQD